MEKYLMSQFDVQNDVRTSGTVIIITDPHWTLNLSSFWYSILQSVEFVDFLKIYKFDLDFLELLFTLLQVSGSRQKSLTTD